MIREITVLVSEGIHWSRPRQLPGSIERTNDEEPFQISKESRVGYFVSERLTKLSRAITSLFSFDWMRHKGHI